MVSGSTDLLQVPWETIIKLYRRARDGKVFPSLSEHADDLFKFIKERRGDYFPAEVQRDAIRALVESVYWELQNQVEKWIESPAKQQRPSPESIRAFTDTTVDGFSRYLSDHDFLDGWGPDDATTVRTEYESDFARTRDEVFDHRCLSAETADLLISIGVDLTVRRHPFADKSVVVVAGYGEGELFPSLKTFDVQGVAMNRLLCKPSRYVVISREKGGDIAAFAQTDMVDTFTTGVDPDYQGYIEKLVGKTLAGLPGAVASATPGLYARVRGALEAALERATSNMVEELRRGIDDYKRQNHSGPVQKTVEFLPKEEMAQLAEALVNLTSMKRRVTEVPETVGGPVDVAVISKGDGFVWVQRKHYFDPILNPRIIGKYYRDAGTTPTTSYRKETE